ncbi:MAG: alanine--tRNA ligase [Firmicutes bacterium]|nr:alanine--tRNA ligase [Bacillota bacterium]
MPVKTANQIRQEFLDFFTTRGHTVVPSASLLPEDDPTLLFTNAGMNQFKDVFLGKGTRPYSRAVNSQKVIRVSGKHNDLEEVGWDTYHHTFFEMLGNWSFGDYYKREAIAWAWELLTKVWGLPPEKLYATVHDSDKEAAALWPEVTGIPAERVLFFGDEDNFWEMGDPGPCGPCTEIHYDLGPEYCDNRDLPGHTCGDNGDCGRYIELWNLVFIQYNRKADGTLEDLPAKHVDTGMGFERIVAVLQGKGSNYETDLFLPILERITEYTGAREADPEHQVAMRVIADHIRALTFAISDGVIPANEGRGYVLRRILRRAARYARTLGVQEPFLHRLVPVVVEVMGDAYPEIRQHEEHCRRVILAEEEAFLRTLDKGLEIFAALAKAAKEKKETSISGEDALRPFDTYGFPLDLTQLLAAEEGLTVEVEGFNRLMEEQRERARKSGKFARQDKDYKWRTVASLPHSRFTGYGYLQAAARLCLAGEDDDHYLLVFDRTPFYPEGGGQVGDTGVIRVAGEEFPVVDTRWEQNHLVHFVPKEKPFPMDETVYILAVAADRRRMTAAHHTATHLLQAVLRKQLGAHIHQAGSLVAPDRLRFDFTHYQRLTAEELRWVEEEVNKLITSALPVWAEETSYQSAVDRGALAFFGEKYEERVRTVQVGGTSLELCGGTHVRNTAEILCFRILSEGSVSTGVRRIEAVAGVAALRRAAGERETLQEAAARLKVEPEKLVSRIEELLAEQARLTRAKEEEDRKHARAEREEILATRVREAGGHRYLVARCDGSGMELLRENIDYFKDKLGSCVALLGASNGGKVHFVAGVTSDLTGKIHAGQLVKKVAAITGGGGGGRPDLAQAGGKDAKKIDEALATGEKLIRELLEG